jgi:hypothetical protein
MIRSDGAKLLVALVLICIGLQASLAGTDELLSLNSSAQESDVNIHEPAMSSDGELFVFRSSSSNFTGGTVIPFWEVYLFNNSTGVVTRLCEPTGGGDPDDFSAEVSISRDGRFATFISAATNLLGPGTTSSGDGFVYLFDGASGSLSLECLAPMGVEPDNDCFFPFVSDGGQFIAFSSYASNYVPGSTIYSVDVYLSDRSSGSVVLASRNATGGFPDSDSWSLSISSDGRYVLYYSLATDIAATTTGRLHLYRFDALTQATELISANAFGVEADDHSLTATYGSLRYMSASGRFVGFSSRATNLVANDTNGYADCFVRDCDTDQLVRVSVSSSGAEGNGDSFGGLMSDDGRYVAFTSSATNLDPGAPSGTNVYIHDRVTGKTRFVSTALDVGPADISGTGRDLLFNDAGIQTIYSQIWRYRECLVDESVYGVGLAGAGGHIPSLTATSGLCIEDGYTIDLVDVVGGAVGLLVAGTQSASVPAYGGTLLVNVATSISIGVGGTLGAPGAGSLSISGADLSSIAGFSVYLQALMNDNAATSGVSMSAGLQLDVVP